MRRTYFIAILQGSTNIWGFLNRIIFRQTVHACIRLTGSLICPVCRHRPLARGRREDAASPRAPQAEASTILLSTTGKLRDTAHVTALRHPQNARPSTGDVSASNPTLASTASSVASLHGEMVWWWSCCAYLLRGNATWGIFVSPRYNIGT